MSDHERESEKGTRRRGLEREGGWKQEGGGGGEERRVGEREREERDYQKVLLVSFTSPLSFSWLKLSVQDEIYSRQDMRRAGYEGARLEAGYYYYK